MNPPWLKTTNAACLWPIERYHKRVSKEAFERKLAELEKLRSTPDAVQIRKALKDKSNYLVAKATAIGADCGLAELIPDLLAAYDRFFVQPVQTDKQCWAKIAIARALKQLEYAEPEPFIKGLYYVQMEPVWGGQEDTAATLRGECAHALTGCALRRDEVLRLLVELLGDASTPVRMDAVRAIAQMDGMEAEIALRVKAMAQPNDLEVTGECLTALVQMAPPRLLPFVTRFLDHEDADVAGEAALSLTTTKDAEVLTFLIQHWEGTPRAAWREAVIRGLAASTLRESAEFLLRVIAEHPLMAPGAVSALGASRYREEFRERVMRAVEDRPELRSLFDARSRP